ncbi:HNH endonuclease [bacterium]|nr:HNH endonuclease [bacterium]
MPNPTIIQYAHIYPVKEIRKSFFNEKNEKINLDDISNEDNFLPLDAETHILYDRNELF